MAALRGSISRLISDSNSKNRAAQLVFCRGITSKLFVKGISFTTTEKSLKDAFTQFGEVVEAKIIMKKDRTRSKGYGYVTFSATDDAQKALIDMNGKLVDGRVISVDYVYNTPKLRGAPNAEADG
ncbi:hypothetical protein EZV62_002146 [Acer yangbiense]|uniref:RRM domain-containing protein n=1 Tax=Acer yangbiense TaxID=1000413 RepID=A0A5C7IW73_9ROSI|nr:hypothetical protein EZV62_002146 [Acer yangbiense]